MMEDINVSTDLALCRACGKTFQCSELVRGRAPRVDLNSPPAGAWFEQLSDGFRVGATTRSYQAFILVPFTCAWAGMSMHGIYGTQIASSHLDPVTSLIGLPFLVGTLGLLAWCALAVAGRATVTRRSDRLSVFVGAGGIGWTRSYAWSDFSSVREELTGYGFNWNRMGRIIVLEGARRVAFGSLWSEDRRYFVLHALLKMLDTADRFQRSAFTSPRNS